MSTEQLQRDLNSLDREIADLEKRKAQKDKEASDYQSKILSTQKTITKNTSISTLNSKQRQIYGYQDNLNKCSKSSAEYASKIAQKKQRRNDISIKLQKSQAEDAKKQEKAYKDMQKMYEKRISDLSNSANPIRYIRNYEETNSIENDVTEYDVFVSHAWEDKEDFVEDFVSELEKLNVKVWYDKKRMTLGDSMREKIDAGLKNSKFGIVILSPNYIADGKYWTKSELNGLFQKESVGGKVLLPIWHKLTKKEVLDYSPILADRLAMNTASYSPEEIAKEIYNLLNKTEETPNGQA